MLYERCTTSRSGCAEEYAFGTGADQRACIHPKQIECVHGGGGDSGCDDKGASKTYSSLAASWILTSGTECACGTGGSLLACNHPSPSEVFCSNGFSSRGASTSGQFATFLGSCASKYVSGNGAHQYVDILPRPTFCGRGTCGCNSFGGRLANNFEL